MSVPVLFALVVLPADPAAAPAVTWHATAEACARAAAARGDGALCVPTRIPALRPITGELLR